MDSSSICVSFCHRCGSPLPIVSIRCSYLSLFYCCEQFLIFTAFLSGAAHKALGSIPNIKRKEKQSQLVILYTPERLIVSKRSLFWKLLVSRVFRIAVATLQIAYHFSSVTALQRPGPWSRPTGGSSEVAELPQDALILIKWVVQGHCWHC